MTNENNLQKELEIQERRFVATQASLNELIKLREEEINQLKKQQSREIPNDQKAIDELNQKWEINELIDK